MAVIKIPSSIGGVSIPGAAIAGPLGALFGNKFSVDSMKYPRDLESSTRGHVVKFSINEVQPVGYVEGKEYSLSDVGSGLAKAAGNLASEAASAIGDKVKSFFGSGKSGDGKTSVSLSLQPSKKTLKATISLYIPESLAFNYDANYGEQTLAGVAGKALEAIGGKAGKMVTSAVESGAGKILLKSQGLAINPNQQLLFDGIPLRTFELSFVFTPYSKQEAQEVKKIIDTFKTHSRPRTVTGTGGMLFIPPSSFNIDFLFNGKPNPYVNKVTECVITSIAVNYTPNGWSAHSDGAPVQTTLTMSFKEIELVDRKKVEAGY